MEATENLLVAFGAAIITFFLTLAEGFIGPIVEGIFGSPDDEEGEQTV